jgi:hypothetical protein
VTKYLRENIQEERLTWAHSFRIFIHGQLVRQKNILGERQVKGTYLMTARKQREKGPRSRYTLQNLPSNPLPPLVPTSW